MQKIRKVLRAVSEIFKDGLRTDGRTTDMGDYIGPLSGKSGVQNVISVLANENKVTWETLREGSQKYQLL